MRSDSQQFEYSIPGLDQDGFALVNASLVYTADSDRFSIGIHGKNLFDKRYVVSGYNYIDGDLAGANGSLKSTLGLDGIRTAFYGDPRRVFVTGEIRF